MLSTAPAGRDGSKVRAELGPGRVFPHEAVTSLCRANSVVNRSGYCFQSRSESNAFMRRSRADTSSKYTSRIAKCRPGRPGPPRPALTFQLARQRDRFFAMLAGFAEMEREMMIERTNDGLAQAAAEGRHGGRRPVISKDMMRIALGRRADGESAASIAKGLTYKTATGDERTVSRRALYNSFKAHDADRTESA